MAVFLTRRALVVASALLLAGCASGPPLPPEARAVPIGRIEGRSVDRSIVHLRTAAILADELGRALGDRYHPGAGATLTVTVDQVVLPDRDYDGFGGRGGSGSGDSISSRNTLTQDGRVIASFPLFSVGLPNDLNIDEPAIPSDGRLRAIARVQAYWIASKLRG